MHVLRLQDTAPTAWRNGGGDTRELLAWPQADEWLLRISVAGIAQDGPFSAYPGVQRWFTVLDGAGVLLTFGDRTHRCTTATSPLEFDGEGAPACHLIDGPTQDLNLMVRTAAGQGRMQAATQPLPPCTLRALYCIDAVTLHRDGAPDQQLPAASLAWSAEPGDQAIWRVAADDVAASARCWWLSLTAQ